MIKTKSELLGLKNVGPALLRDLQLLGIKTIEQLRTETADKLYEKLQNLTGVRQDPCVWDTFAAIVCEAQTGEKLPWWHWSQIRKNKALGVIKLSKIDTPLGPMLAVADNDALLLLGFTERSELTDELDRLRRRTKTTIQLGSNRVLVSVAEELRAYFAGSLKEFKTPLKLFGTEFQNRAWHQLQQIPYGETKSYLEQAQASGKPIAYRAVANANGANQIVIIIPCHRVINSNGSLGGYGGGVARKKWLLEHEKAYS